MSLTFAKAQDNIAEIDITKPVTMGWDYILPDNNVEGFKIYRQKLVNDVLTWELIGTIPTPIDPLDLKFVIPQPSIGTYTVTAYNAQFESEYADPITLIEAPPTYTEPLPPTNLRVIQITQ
jgi:hypothetical protein